MVWRARLGTPAFGFILMVYVMKALRLKYWGLEVVDFMGRVKWEYHVLVFLVMVWFFVPGFLNRYDAQAGFIDQNILLLMVLSVICFLGLLGLCWWLLDRFWRGIGLPGVGLMVLQFKDLELWMQLGFYLCSFALLLLAAVGCMMAIC